MKEVVKESMQFFKTLGLALVPWQYDEVKERQTRQIFKYFFSFVFLAFVLAIILMLPAIGSFIDRQMSHFDRLEVKFNTSMNSPVVFPEHDPFVTLDTRKSTGTLKEGRFLITDDYLYMKGITGRVTSEALGGYKNLLANEGIVIAIVLLMLPSLLFLFYIMYAIKVLLLVLLAALIGFIVVRVIKFEARFVNILKTGLLAATPMIIIDLVRLPFGFNVYFAQYVAFAIFFIVGIVKIGDFEGMGSHRKKRRHAV